MTDPPVLITTQCFPPRHGGVETLMAELARALARRGHPVKVFADAPGAAETWPEGVRVRRFGGPKPLRRWRKGRAVAARAASGPPPLIVADSWKSLEWLGATGPGARILCLAHGMEFPAAPSPRRAARIRAAMVRADAVAANSRFTAGLAAPYAPPERIVVVPPGVTPPAPADAAALAAMDARIGGGRPLVVTLARLEPRKGVDMTLRAVAALAPRHPGLTCAVAGGGPDAARLAALAEDLGLAERVVFLGRVDEAAKAALLARADLFCMPSRREGDSVEGFGIVYLEAGAFGVPAVAGVGGGAEDAVADGETGLLCDGTSAEAVTAALGALLDDAALRSRLGEGARRRAAAAGWDVAVEGYLAAAGLRATP